MATNSPSSLGTDSIGSLLFKYSLPAIVAMASASLFNVIDSIFVGHGVGGAAIAGMAITLPIMNVAVAFGAMVGVGAGARISIRIGEGNKIMAEKILCNAIILNLIIGTLISVVMLCFMDEILILFSGGKANQDTLQYAKDFMTIIMAFNVITHLYLGMNDMMRASGYPTKAMRIVLVSVLINIILNPLFIFHFHWGIKGSALATIISQSISFVLALRHFLSSESFIHFKRKYFRIDFRIIAQILSIGLAPFLLNICASMVATFVNKALLEYGGSGKNDTVGADGDVFVSAYGIVNRIALLFVMIVQGFNQGMQPIVGYNYGAKNMARVKKALFTTIVCAVSVGFVTFAAIELFPEGIAGLFVDTSKGERDFMIMQTATTAIRTILILCPLVGFQIVAGNFFQYIGKAHLSIFTNLTRQLLFLLPFIWTLPVYYGAYGVWISMPLADCGSILLSTTLLIREIRKLNRQSGVQLKE
ncbi:MAG: MATE family efflux transporter [Alistipes sp.]|nr:MATE family efflux transporter [Candidatus Alistipes equi]